MGGAILNGGKVQREPRIGMVVQPIGGRYLAMQSAGAPHLWSRLTALIGHPELATDPRFSTPMARRANWHDLLKILHAYTENRYVSFDAQPSLPLERGDVEGDAIKRGDELRPGIHAE